MFTAACCIILSPSSFYSALPLTVTTIASVICNLSFIIKMIKNISIATAVSVLHLMVTDVVAFMQPTPNLQHRSPTVSNNNMFYENRPCSQFPLGSSNDVVSVGLLHYHQGKRPLSILNASNDSNSNKRTTSLLFTGEKVYKSEPIPILHDITSSTSTPSSNDILSFFQNEEVRSILLNGDREDSIELIANENVNKEMMDLWTKQAMIVGGDLPNMSKGDVVFKVNTGGINFSGLNIKSSSLIGVKYLNESNNNSSSGSISPEYQLVFINDSQIVDGPRVLVWIYNQLTGKKTKTKKDHDNDDEGKEQSVRAFSRFTYETTPDGESIIFSVESTLEVVVKFPSLLLKILPVSKEKAEEQGSASVLKAMGKDIEAVLPKVRSFYLKTFEKIPVS